MNNQLFGYKGIKKRNSSSGLIEVEFNGAEIETGKHFG